MYKHRMRAFCTKQQAHKYLYINSALQFFIYFHCFKLKQRKKKAKNPGKKTPTI